MEKICLLTVAILVFGIMSGCGEPDTEPWKNIGKDTHKVYGDGTYQIVNYSNVDEDKIYRAIINDRCDECCVDEVCNIKETEDKIYVYGKNKDHDAYKNNEDHDVYLTIDMVTNIGKYFEFVPPGEESELMFKELLIDTGKFEILNSYEEFDVEEKEMFKSMHIPKNQFSSVY